MAACGTCNGQGGKPEPRSGGAMGWRFCGTCGGSGKANEPPPDHISKKKK